MSTDPDPRPVPTFARLGKADQARVYEAAGAFADTLARDPAARLADFTVGFDGDALAVLVQEMTAEAFEFKRARAERAITAEILAQLPRPQADIATERLSRQTAVPAPPAADAPTSLRLPGYTILPEPEPKAGGCAVVYFARDARLPRTVAVKVPKGDDWANADAAARFRSEARLQAQLRDAGVPAVFEFGHADDGRPFIAMERVDGDPLRARLPNASRAVRFGVADAERVELIRRVALAVAPAHCHPDQICHLDLSPDNVLVAAADRVVILDWGLGRQRAAPAAEAIGGGTPNYLAPEKVRGRVELFGPKCDVFSLGCFLIQVLTGQPLFPAGSAAEKVRQAHEYDFAAVAARLDGAEALWGLPRELVELTKRCLAEEPGKRPEDAGAVAEQIAAYQAAAERERLDGRVREERRRVVRRWVRVAACVALIGAAASGYFVWRAGEARERAAVAETHRRMEEANALAGRGAWYAARDKYRGLLAARHRDDAGRFELRLRLLRADQFLNSRAAAADELERLRADPLGERFRGRLDFEEAVELMTRSMEYTFQSEDGLGAETNSHEMKAERLLAAVRDDPAVPEADRWTARGLLATSADMAIDCYQEALRLEPFHPYAGPHYLLTCLLAGRLDQALARAGAWAEASPRDPLPWFYKAFVLTLRREHAKADEALTQLAQAGGDRPLPLDTAQACRAVVKLARSVDTALPEVAAADDVPVMVLLTLLAEIQAARDVLAPARELVLMTLPVSPNQRRAFGRFLGAAAVIRTDPRAALAHLAAVENFVAPGTVLFARGMALAWSAPLQRDFLEKVRALGEAADCMRAGAGSDRHLLNVNVICRLCLAKHALSAAGHPLFAKDAERLSQEARNHMLSVAAEPDLSEGIRRKVRSMAGAISDPGFAAQVEALLARRP